MSVEAPERPMSSSAEVGEDAAEASAAAGEGRRPKRDAVLAAAASVLATAGAGWMTAGLFKGTAPRLVAILAAIVGVGLTLVADRARSAALSYLVVPIIILLGGLLTIPEASGGSANLLGFVAEAIDSGGLLQPPLPLLPGWRFLLFLVIGVLGATSMSLAGSVGRPKLAIVIPGLLMMATAVAQPAEGTLTSVTVALVLFILAFAVGFGRDLMAEGATDGGFETRRFGRAALVIALLVGLLAVIAQAGFLLPESQRDQVIPPQRPAEPVPSPDRELFTYLAAQPIPLRLGVLDVYGLEETAWLTPPFDPRRFLPIDDPNVVPQPPGPGIASPLLPQDASPPPMEVAITIRELGGQILPSVPGLLGISHDGYQLDYDPRTNELRLPDVRASAGLTYTLTARPLPTVDQLDLSPALPEHMLEYLVAPPPPQEVTDLLAQAPGDASPFTRLQFARNEYFRVVVAAGAGTPVDVSAARVGELLHGEPASPFEITAGEVLLARWFGVPARLGYGYHGGDREDGLFSVRPKDGATWLEVYFEGHGWFPVLGTPPQAQASLSSDPKNEDESVRPTDVLALSTFVPIRRQSVQLLYEQVRYWLALGAPWLILILMIWFVYPGPLKAVRRLQRRRWASTRGWRAQLATAYAEMRDVANDFNVGDVAMTPLEFRDVTDHDVEHEELAWLVTRGVWADLARDLQASDVDVADDLAQSVSRRLRQAHTSLNRLLAFVSRASLREPYSEELPNPWPRVRRRQIARHPLQTARALGTWLAAGRWKVVVPVIVIVSLAGAAVSATDVLSGSRVLLASTEGLPENDAPPRVEDLRFTREPEAELAYVEAGEAALVTDGRVFAIRRDDSVVGSLQMAQFIPGNESSFTRVRDGMLRELANGRFELMRFGADRFYVSRLSGQTVLVWFSPSLRWFQLLVASDPLEDPERLLLDVLAFQTGDRRQRASTPIAPIDHRRGESD